MNGDVDAKPEEDSKTNPPSTSSVAGTERKNGSRSSRRKYVLEWRTVIFIRHGKSKWNAAEGDPLSKVVAAGKGFFEYYKHKKLQKVDTKTNRKSEIDIMDAPLSREGIMEALNLCTYLREYTRNNQLTAYNELFENTRSEMNDILLSLGSAADAQVRQEMTDKLKQCLQRLDQFKVDSLVANQPPQDDDNLRLPHPVPEIPRSPVIASSAAAPTPPHPVSVESNALPPSNASNTVSATTSTPISTPAEVTKNNSETPIPSEVASDSKREVVHRTSIASNGSAGTNGSIGNGSDQQIYGATESNPNSTKLDALNENVEIVPTMKAGDSLKSQTAQSPDIGAVDCAPDTVPVMEMQDTPKRAESFASMFSEVATPTISPRSAKNVEFPDDPAPSTIDDNGNINEPNGTVHDDPNNPSTKPPTTTLTNGPSSSTTNSLANTTEGRPATEMNGRKSKSSKRYMQPIEDPQNPLNAEYVVELLNGNKPKCGIVVSNLRRAMSTACICLHDRLERRPC